MAKVQVKIGGMSCSFCALTLHKAVGQLDGVEKVNVSLAHEEALVEYDPARVEETQIKDAIRSVGYTVRDPTKVRTFEEEEAELKRERDRLIIAAAFTWMAFLSMVMMWIDRPLPGIQWLMPVLAVGTVFGPGLLYPAHGRAFHTPGHLQPTRLAGVRGIRRAGGWGAGLLPARLPDA
jgi:copper ion binding protein